MLCVQQAKQCGKPINYACLHGEQVRPLQPNATHATDEDTLELMEMILGALGRDAVGLGSE